MTVAKEAAKLAGQLVLGAWRTGAEVSLKGDIDIVTEFDLKSEKIIRETILSAFPDDKVVGEESDVVGDSERVWYVDPIDGTTNFAHGHPIFSVSIAMYNGDEPRVGLVLAPALGITWSAARGAGAFRNGEPCKVSQRATLSDALCATGFPYDRWTNPENNVREFEYFLLRTRGVRRGGSAAIDLCMLADGTYDIYWERGLNAWDMCAGALIIQEAGGQLSNYAGGAADPRSGEVVATNGQLHQEALRALK